MSFLTIVNDFKFFIIIVNMDISVRANGLNLKLNELGTLKVLLGRGYINFKIRFQESL